MIKFISLVAIAAMFIISVHGQDCADCDTSKCPSVADCRTPVLMDDCNCCQVCPKATVVRHNDLNRIRRALYTGRRAGLTRQQARQHTHSVYGGIPDHIRQMLLRRGVKL